MLAKVVYQDRPYSRSTWLTRKPGVSASPNGHEVSTRYGASAERVRGYLKAVSKAGWELVNWLTHAHGATRADGMMANELTEHIVILFATGVLRYRQGIPIAARFAARIISNYGLMSLARE